MSFDNRLHYFAAYTLCGFTSKAPFCKEVYSANKITLQNNPINWHMLLNELINPSGAEAEIFRENQFPSNAVDALVPKIISNHTIWIMHDDVIKQKHFPRYCTFVRGIHRWPVDSPYKGQWRGAFIAPPRRGFWSPFGGVCSLTYCNGNFRVTMVSEPFNVIL